MLRNALLVFLVLAAFTCRAQMAGEVVEKDTVVKRTDKDEFESRKDPSRATLLSAVLPGAGQIYNEKYWKLPIIYAGLGTSVYFILDNRQQYLKFRGAYLNDLDSNNELSVYGQRGISTAQLRAAADQYRQWMEWSYLAFGIVYVLQIVDAAVDAHLYYFDVSDDLTLHWRPEVYATRNRGMATGFTLSLNF